MGTITGKFHQNPLKTVGGVAETRFSLRADGRTDGRTDEPITIVPFDWWTKMNIVLKILIEEAFLGQF